MSKVGAGNGGVSGRKIFGRFFREGIDSGSQFGLR